MSIEHIKQLFKKQGIKNTSQRQSVYEVLLKSKKPLSAESIYQALLDQNSDSVNLSTVYRVLEVFTQKHLVIRSTLSVEGRATYEINHHEHRHHLSCVSCGAIKPIKGCPLEAYEKSLVESTGYQIVEHRLEILGICPECQNKDNK